MRFNRALTSAIVCGCTGIAAADLVTIHSNHDNTMYQNAAGSISNGAGTGMFTGLNSQSVARRALLSFDIAAAIPAGSIINDVILTLHLSRSSAETDEVGLHRTLAAWGEGTSVASGEGGSGAASTAGDATWVHTFFPGQTWAAAGGGPGGFFVPAASATTAVGGGNGFFVWQTAEMAADVQAWLDAPASNFGWTLRGEETVAGSANRFDTHEHADINVRPTLEISYTPVPTPATAGLFVVAGAAFANRRRRSSR